MSVDSSNSNNKKICIDCGILCKYLVKSRCDRCYRRNRMQESPKRKCICDPTCEIIIPSINYNGKPNYYAYRHGIRGERHPNWKGGRCKINQYWYIYKPYHPFCNNRGYYAEHRWIYENHYNCILLPWIDIHHINEQRDDNRIENLKPMTHEEHGRIHNKNGIGRNRKKNYL